MILQVWVRPRPQQQPGHTRMPIDACIMQCYVASDPLGIDIAAAVGQEQLHDLRMALARGALQRSPAVPVERRSGTVR
jgi:hypothetical protein